MNKKKLRCVVIGLGRIGWLFHLPQIRKQPGFELAAVVDPDTQRLQEARQEFAVPLTLRNCAEVPLGEIDLAVIASPTHFHCAQAHYFLERGVDVFCDKPMALSWAEGEAMAECAARHGRRLTVYQPHRVTSDCLTAQQIIASGKLGEIYQIYRSCHNYSRRNDWQALTANGGGMLHNYGAHYIDQMFYLGGDSCARVACETRQILTLGDADDMVRALITGRSGCLYDLDINMASAISMPRLALYGRLGTAVTRDDGSWRLRYCPADQLPEINLHEELAAAGRRYPAEKLPWQEENLTAVPADADAFYRHVFSYFAEGGKPLVPIAETLEVMRTLDLCQAAAVRAAAQPV